MVSYLPHDNKPKKKPTKSYKDTLKVGVIAE